MSYEIDHADLDPYARKIYELLEVQRRKLWDAKYNLGFHDKVNTGIQEFRVERRAAVQLLLDHIGDKEAAEFNGLHAAVLKLHPSQLAMNYIYREFSQQEVDNHASFLSAIMKRIKNGSIEFNGADIKRKRELVLRILYKACESQSPSASFDDLADSTDIDIFELENILGYLEKKLLIKTVSHTYSITLLGEREIEKMGDFKQETLSERRYRVLNTIYDLAKGDSSTIVSYYEVENITQVDSATLPGILDYLEGKSLIFVGDQWVRITTSGIDQIEETRLHPEQATKYFPANIYNNVFNAPVSGVQQGGQGNVQTININSGSQLTEAINKLIELIEQSSVPQLQKVEAVSDLRLLGHLSELEKTPEVRQKAESKIQFITSTLALTADMVTVGMPLIMIVRAFFER